jgi:hypothetical protein
MKVAKNSTKGRRTDLAHYPPAVRRASPRADVHVIFTNPQATRAALQAANAMIQSEEARIHLLVPQVVPMGFPLDRPPVSVAFAEQRAAGMARECCPNAAVQVQIVLCGNREQCIERTLGSNSLVMIGSRKQPWLATEKKLARQLRASGHRVIHVLEQ